MDQEKRGRCAWCGRHNQRLVFVVWVLDERLFTDWVCDHCRRAMSATVNESED